MHGHSPYRAGKDRELELLSEQLQTRINIRIRAQRVHIHLDISPGIEVADCGQTQTLRARPRDLVSAGFSVADRTCLALVTDTFSRTCEQLVISHFSYSSLIIIIY